MSIYDAIANIGGNFNPAANYVQAKAAGEQSKLNDIVMKAKQQELDNAAKLPDLMSKYQGGDDAVLNQIMAVDPNVGKLLYDVKSKADETKKKQFSDNLNMISGGIRQFTQDHPDATQEQIAAFAQQAEQSFPGTGQLIMQHGPQGVLSMSDFGQKFLLQDAKAKSDMELESAKKPPTSNVYIDQGKGNLELLKQDIADIGKAQTVIEDRGRGAAENLDLFNQMNVLLDKVKTGADQQTVYKLKLMANKFGFDVTDETFKDQQKLDMFSGEMVRQYLNQATGPQTDSDRSFLQTITPGLGKTTESNKAMVGFQKSRALLDKHFAVEMRKTRTIRDYEGRIQKATDLQNLSDNIPAGTIIDGKAVTFDSFHAIAKQEGIPFEEILKDWQEVTQ